MAHGFLVAVCRLLSSCGAWAIVIVLTSLVAPQLVAS